MLTIGTMVGARKGVEEEMGALDLLDGSHSGDPINITSNANTKSARFRLLVCFCQPPELFVPQCDYNLTLQETGRVQGLKNVHICQSEFAAAAAVE
ncbi:hypothetical protein JOQ06_000424, partial [Pogonophryne albipinna]